MVLSSHFETYVPRNRLLHVQTANRFSSSVCETHVYSRCDGRPYRKAHKRKEAPSFPCWSNKRRGIISRIYDFRNTSANAEFPRHWKVLLDLSPGPLSFPFSPTHVATRHKILIQPSQSYHKTLARESRSSNLASALREIELPPSAWIKYIHRGTASLSNVKFFFRVIYALLSLCP